MKEHSKQSKRKTQKAKQRSHSKKILFLKKWLWVVVVYICPGPILGALLLKPQAVNVNVPDLGDALPVEDALGGRSVELKDDADWRVRYEVASRAAVAEIGALSEDADDLVREVACSRLSGKRQLLEELPS